MRPGSKYDPKPKGTFIFAVHNNITANNLDLQEESRLMMTTRYVRDFGVYLAVLTVAWDATSLYGDVLVIVVGLGTCKCRVVARAV